MSKRGYEDPSRNFKRQKLVEDNLSEGCENILDTTGFMHHLLLEILFANPDTRIPSSKRHATFVRKFNTDILDKYYIDYGRQVFAVLDDAFLITHQFTNIERKTLVQLIIRFVVSTIESEVMTSQDINVMCDRVYRILTTKHNELYDLRVSLLEYVDSLYDKNEVLGLRILEALLDICSLNSQASINTIYKALQQLPSLCSSFYPELGPKKQTICRIVLFYFQKFVEGYVSDTIVVEFVKLWNLIARAEFQYASLNSGAMLNFVNEIGMDVTNYLLQFLVRPYLDKPFRNTILEALSVMNKVSQIEEITIPFILKNMEKQSDKKEIALRLAFSISNDDMLNRNSKNLPHFMQLLLNLLVDTSTRHVRGQACKVVSVLFNVKCSVFESNKNTLIAVMNEILNGCNHGIANSFKALASFPTSWFPYLEGFDLRSIIRMMLKNLLIGNVVNKTTEATKFKKRLVAICDGLSSWSIHFPESLDEVIDTIINVLLKIDNIPVPLHRTQVVPLKYQCMLYIATREQDLGCKFSIIPFDLMNELQSYKEIDDDIRFCYQKSLVSAISNILQNATYEIQPNQIDRLWPKLKLLFSSPRSEVHMEALRLAALLSSRWNIDKHEHYAKECINLLSTTDAFRDQKSI